jgi:hypothetical protein
MHQKFEFNLSSVASPKTNVGSFQEIGRLLSFFSKQTACCVRATPMAITNKRATLIIREASNKLWTAVVRSKKQPLKFELSYDLCMKSSGIKPLIFE